MKASELLDNYIIREDGAVYSKLSGKYLKQDLSTAYASVVLSKDGKKRKFSVHRLVAITYIPNPENKRCVNHIDGNKRNNHYVNLEWATYQENERHSFKSLGKQIQHSDTTKEKMRAKAKGRDMTKAVSAAAAAKKGKPAINRCRVILNNSIIYNSITEASEDKRVSITAIMNNLSGLSKKTKVGVWQYE